MHSSTYKSGKMRLLAITAATSAVLAFSAQADDHHAPPVPFTGTVPQAHCSPGDHTESGLQGETTEQERFGGDSERAYNCNLELVGQEPQGAFEGAYSQDGPAYAGDCAYYGTDNATSHGVTVIDASDPRHPVVAGYLDDTAAARAPHETVRTSERRHILVVAQSNGPDFAVYDTSDCRHPALLADIQLPGGSGHMGNFSPDGRTYWVSQSFRGVGGFLYIVDLTDPSNPQMLPPWQFLGDGRPHAPYLNPEGFEPGVPEGTRLYAGQPGEFGAAPTSSSFGPDGLVIEDVSDYQFRRPNPQIRIISTLFWDDQGQAESMIPVKIKGHPYLISTDEAGGAGAVDGWAGACSRGASPFGYPQIIDVGDETHPKIIAKLRAGVSDPANCSALLAETPPDVPGTAPGTNLPAISGTTNYSEERCVADNPNNAKMMACSFQHAGLRVFDISDPYHPSEIAYWKPGAVRTEVQPASGSWRAGVVRTVDKIAGWARWHSVAPANEHAKEIRGRQLELWTVSDGHGFQVLRFTKTFIALHKDLFDND
jgi:hypothetical protein